MNVQEAHASALLRGEERPNVVYAVEHPPTITIGRSGTPDHIVADRDWLEQIGMAVHETDRGGDVTYHGPGQVVLYPVLGLAPWGNDIKRYVRLLEETVIQALAKVGIVAGRLSEYPGVWVEHRKICAVGVRVRRKPSGEFVTTHGIALNVATDLAHFQAIIPCGISDKGVTSVSAELDRPVTFAEWESRLREAFLAVFQDNQKQMLYHEHDITAQAKGGSS